MSKIVIGTNTLAKELGALGGWEVLGGKTLIPFNFKNIKTYAIWIAEHDTVINCVDYEDHSENPLHKMEMIATNYTSVMNLVDYCNLTYKKIVHISTVDVSWKNPMDPYDVPVHRGDWYSYTKLMAEGYIHQRADSYLILRTFFKNNRAFYPYPVSEQTNINRAKEIAKSIYEMIEDDCAGIRVVPIDPYTRRGDVCVYSALGEDDGDE